MLLMYSYLVYKSMIHHTIVVSCIEIVPISTTLKQFHARPQHLEIRPQNDEAMVWRE